MTLIAIAYVGAVSSSVVDADLAALTREWSELCAREAVTGVLIHRDGSLVGFLEGESCAANRVYSRVNTDPRLTQLIEVLNGPSDHREFLSWSFADRFPEDPPLVRAMPGRALLRAMWVERWIGCSDGAG